VSDQPVEELLIMKPGDLLAKLVRDVYFGNGKPALTLRIASVEDQQDMFQNALDESKKWQSSATKLLIASLISSIGGLIAIIVELIRH
jgi:hypothetical protein